MSDLLNQASLVYIPSGYKEDTAYSVIPTDGSGDLTFTRASDGTRVNSAGLVENVPWNLLEYSNNFSNGVWFTSSTSVTSGQSGYNGTSNAWLLTSSASNGFIYQNNTINGVNTFALYCKAGTNTQIILYSQHAAQGKYFDLSSGTVGANFVAAPISASIETVGNGWYRCSIVVTASANAGWRIYNVATGTTYIQNAQCNIGSTAKPYFPTTDRLNVPRLTYSGGCPSLLLEPQRTNVVTYSEQFDDAIWFKSTSNSVTANATISPDGTQNADFIVSTATNSAAKYVYQVFGSTATPTATIYAKAGAVTEMMFYCQGGNGIYFNLTNGSFIAYYGSGASTITSYSSVAMGNGWYRYAINFNTSVTSLEAYLSKNTNITASIANGDGFYLWGAQLEAGSYATSYIPTTSSSATRVADACYKTGISSLIGQSEGTILLDCLINTTNSQDLLSIRPGGTSAVAIGTASNLILGYVIEGATVIALQFSNYQINTRYKIALAYKNGDCALYINGTQADTDSTAFTFSTALSSLYLGQSQYFGKESYQHNQTALFPTRLTNTELAALTTL